MDTPFAFLQKVLYGAADANVESCSTQEYEMKQPDIDMSQLSTTKSITCCLALKVSHGCFAFLESAACR